MSQRRIAGLMFVALLSLGLALASPVSAEVAAPAAVAASAPATHEAAPAAPSALPQQTPKPLFLSTFQCNCQVFDGCTGSWWYDSTTCQSGQQCYCRTVGIDYPDGYTCYSSLTAECF